MDNPWATFAVNNPGLYASGVAMLGYFALVGFLWLMFRQGANNDTPEHLIDEITKGRDDDEG